MTNVERVNKLTDLCEDSVREERHWDARLRTTDFVFLYSGREFNHPRYHCYINRDGSYDSIAIDYPYSRGYKEQEITSELIDIVDEMIDHVWSRRVFRLPSPSSYEFYSEIRRNRE